MFAPLVALAVARKPPGATALAIASNLFGILDVFLGPPLGILTHIRSLRNLAAMKRGPQELPDAARAAIA